MQKSHSHSRGTAAPTAPPSDATHSSGTRLLIVIGADSKGWLPGGKVGRRDEARASPFERQQRSFSIDALPTDLFGVAGALATSRAKVRAATSRGNRRLRLSGHRYPERMIIRQLR